MLWRQGRPRMLWDVTTAVQVTNERVAGIVGPNPVKIPEEAVAGVFQVSVVNPNRALSSLRIYGGISNTGFPPVNTPAEALVARTVTINAVFGILRQPAPNNVNASRVRAAPFVLPRFLLLEYSTAAIASGDNTLHFNVFFTWVGPAIYGIS